MKPDSSLIPDLLSAVSDLFNVLPDAVIMVDSTGSIVLANDAVQRLLGYDAEELVGQPLERLIPPHHRIQHAQDVAQFRVEGKPKVMGARPALPAINKAGKVVPVSISISNIDIRGERLSIAVIRDASAIRDYLDKASAGAESDALTGMGNRLSLSHRMQAAFDAQHPFALLFLDLTKFKPFNDQHGHQIGDQVLHMVAERIQGHVRSNDLEVRLGGDEFVILLDGVTDTHLLEMRANAIAASIAKPFQIENISASIGVNIGGALYPRDGSTEKELLMSADRNMYKAKESQEVYWIDPDPE